MFCVCEGGILKKMTAIRGRERHVRRNGKLGGGESSDF